MSALDIQVGGEHYKNAKIQPIQYIEANGLGFLEGCVVKRITRHDKPTGKGRQDIEKAIHELQLLLEFRYPPVQPQHPDDIYSALVAPKTPLVRGAFAEPPGEETYAEFLARMYPPTTFHERVAEIDMSVQRAVEVCLARGVGLPEALGETCPECGYPTDAAGTHYATCSQLTAPEEYKAEAQAAFDEAAGIADALARRVSAGNIEQPHPSRQKSAWDAEEPAAAMDDDSPRMQAIGQNGEMGAEVYAAIDDPWAGAPEWAKYKAQDEDGEWRWYARRPVAQPVFGYWVVSKGRIDVDRDGEPNPNWRDTLITRT